MQYNEALTTFVNSIFRSQMKGLESSLVWSRGVLKDLVLVFAHSVHSPLVSPLHSVTGSVVGPLGREL